jgi:hypothetical protein
MNISKKTISRDNLESMTADEIAETFRENDLEVCLEPLSEWGSDLETLFQKLEKGVMQWYETGVKRSLTICFLDEDARTVSQQPSSTQHSSTQPTTPSDSVSAS